MLLFYWETLPQESVFEFPVSETKHLQVMRPRVGQMIYITDGKGNVLKARILEIQRRSISLKPVDRRFIKKPYKHRIEIAIAPTKNTDRMEWFVEKCTEIGVDKITFLMTQHSERKHFKIERVEKKAISAMKQSLKYWLPEIQSPMAFETFIKNVETEHKFIAYVDHENPIHLAQIIPQNENYSLLIGPEGDFSTSELELALNHGFKKVSLGCSRLRTETAGVLGCHLLNLANEVPN